MRIITNWVDFTVVPLLLSFIISRDFSIHKFKTVYIICLRPNNFTIRKRLNVSFCGIVPHTYNNKM